MNAGQFVLFLMLVSFALGDGTKEKVKCQVCKAFCHEFETRVADKEIDEHHSVAVENARGNTSLWTWDYAMSGLVPPREGQENQPNPDLEPVLDELLTHYVEDVVLHALHATAHRRKPPRISWSFCHRVWCVEHAHICQEIEAHKDRLFETLHLDYDGYKRILEDKHAEMDEDVRRRVKGHPLDQQGPPHEDLEEMNRPPEDLEGMELPAEFYEQREEL